jgi:hypothetical protein
MSILSQKVTWSMLLKWLQELEWGATYAAKWALVGCGSDDSSSSIETTDD